MNSLMHQRGKFDAINMGLTGLLTGFVIMLFVLPVPQPPQDAAERLPATEFAIVDVTLFDGETFREHRDVWVEAGRIKAVGRRLKLPDGLPRVDGRGKTLMPGLIDAHVHTWGDSLADALRFGVTTVLDQFTAPEMLTAARPLRNELAPADRADLFSAGRLVTATGGHGTQFGIEVDPIDDPTQAGQAIASRIASGSDWIKIVYDDGSAYGLDIPTLDRETLQAAVLAAKAAGKLAVVHVGKLEDAMTAVEVGADGLVHAWADAVISEEQAAAIKAAGAFVTPTLAIIGGVPQENLPAEIELSSFQRQSLNTPWPDEVTRGNYATATASVAALSAAGVTILAGSDAPNPGTAFGISLHHELALLVASGLSTEQALTAATAAAMDAYQIDDRGRVAEGMLADLVLLDADPRESITNTTAIAAVWKDGFPADLQTLEEPSGVVLQPGLVDDFSATDLAGFSVTTDERMGGASIATMDVEQGVLFVQGEIRAGSPYPWAGAALVPSQSNGQVMDFSTVDAISFRVRGDGGRYRLMLFSNRGGGVPPMVNFEAAGDWQDYRFEISQFGEPDELHAIGMAWVSQGPMPGEFAFQLDDIRFE